MTDHNGLKVIRETERIIWMAGWHIQEQSVLAELASTRGLACGRLEPRSDVIQLVTYDGEHLGHVRRAGSRGPDESWVAVLRRQRRQVGTYASATAGAMALAEACGKITWKTS